MSYLGLKFSFFALHSRDFIVLKHFKNIGNKVRNQVSIIYILRIYYLNWNWNWNALFRFDKIIKKKSHE